MMDPTYPVHTHARGQVCLLCEEALHGPMYRITADLSFADAAQRFIDSLTAPGPHRYRKAKTLKDYSAKIKALNVFFAELPLEKIHLGHFREYQVARAENRPDATSPIRAWKKGRSQGPFDSEAEALLWIKAHGMGYTIVRTPWAAPAGADLINGELYIVQRLMTLAGLWTPLMTQQYERYQADDEEIPKAMTGEQQELFLSVAKSRPEWHTLYCYSVLALHLCWSSDEMRAIRQGDINLAYQVIAVNRKAGKNRHRRRETPITDPEAMWALEELLRRSRELVGTSPELYLFPWSDRGRQWDGTRHMGETGLRKQFDAVREIAGVPWFGFNAFRHTGCTRLAEAGTPMPIIQARAGHCSPKMTEHYLWIMEGAERRAVERASDYHRKPIANVVPIAQPRRLRFGR